MKPILPLLVCELALHGEGDLSYYRDAVNRLARWWPGWPRIAIKWQVWTDPSSPWAGTVKAMHGRPPLKSLTVGQSHDLVYLCQEHGFLAGWTPHDLGAFPNLAGGCQPDFKKLGSFETKSWGDGLYVASTDDTIIASFPPGSVGLLRKDLYALECVSAYPANAPWCGRGIGYSCHAVPSRAKVYALEAAVRGASIIEVHVTMRSPGARPRPGDMCVSLSPGQFTELAELLGEVWSAS